jgi:hypothetical protein
MLDSLGVKAQWPENLCADRVRFDRHPSRPRSAGHRHHHSSERVFVRRRHFNDSRRAFVTGAIATIGGKSVAVTLVDMDTLKIATPALTFGLHCFVFRRLSHPVSNFSLAKLIQNKVNRSSTIL